VGEEKRTHSGVPKNREKEGGSERKVADGGGEVKGNRQAVGRRGMKNLRKRVGKVIVNEFVGGWSPLGGDSKGIERRLGGDGSWGAGGQSRENSSRE